MPRMIKQEARDLESKYRRQSLEKLDRKQIQELAKKESIKANMTTQKIVAALLKLFKGPEALEASIPDGPGAAASHAARRSPSSDGESGSPSDRASPGRRRPTPYPGRRPRRASGSRSSQAPGADAIPPSVRAAVGPDPTDKDIRDVRRRLTALNNEQVSLKGEVGGMQRHLKFASETLERGTRFLEETAWRREAMEGGFANRMLYTRHLWDGSVHMAAADRKVWRRFVAENSRRHAFIQEDEDEDWEGEGEGERMEDDEEEAIGEVSRALVEDDDYDGEDIY